MQGRGEESRPRQSAGHGGREVKVRTGAGRRSLCSSDGGLEITFFTGTRGRESLTSQSAGQGSTPGPQDEQGAVEMRLFTPPKISHLQQGKVALPARV